MDTWFDDPVLGKLPPQEAAVKLREVGENEAADMLPESLQPILNWDEWVYHPTLGQIVKRSDQRQLIPYNYLIFSISRYDGK